MTELQPGGKFRVSRKAALLEDSASGTTETEAEAGDAAGEGGAASSGGESDKENAAGAGGGGSKGAKKALNIRVQN